MRLGIFVVAPLDKLEDRFGYLVSGIFYTTSGYSLNSQSIHSLTPFSAKSTMRGFVVKELTHPSNITVSTEAPEPTPAPDQVIVDVYSAGLNFFDVRIIHLYLYGQN